MTKSGKYLLWAVPTVMLCASISAKVDVGTPFADNMVLQREKPVAVWGTAAPGETVTVAFAGQSVKTTADAGGKWKTHLAPMPANKVGGAFRVSGAGSSCTFTNVVLGEVWLCSGQSNMDMPLVHDQPRWGDNWGALIAQTARKPDIRMASAPSGWSVTEMTQRERMSWHAFTPEYLRSGRRLALACYWGLDLHAALDIPIGLVTSAQGGSGIDPWIPAEGFASVPALKDLMDYVCVKDWKPEMKTDLLWSIDQQPRVQWNARLASFAPYTLRGAIWYQGETNAKEPQRYADKMHALYNGWSKKFENPDFKLYFVQLAPWGFEDIAKIQIAQAKFAAEEKNAGMAVINDLGDLKDIHPDNKLLVSKRLVQHALKHDYGFPEIEADSPTLKSYEIKDGRFILRFNHARRLYIHNPERNLDAGFEVAGPDGKWYKGRVENAHNGAGSWTRFGNITNDFVVVSAPEVKEPCALRHLFSRPWRGCLYNEATLPTGAFEIKR